MYRSPVVMQERNDVFLWLIATSISNIYVAVTLISTGDTKTKKNRSCLLRDKHLIGERCVNLVNYISMLVYLCEFYSWILQK